MVNIPLNKKTAKRRIFMNDRFDEIMENMEREMEELKQINSSLREENERLKDLNGIEKCFSVDKAFEGFHVSNVQSKRRALNVIKAHGYTNIYALKDITVQELCKWPEVGPAIIAIIYIVMEHYGMIMEIPSKALFASPMFLYQLTKRIEDNRKTVTFDI